MIIDNLTVYFSNYRCFKQNTGFGPLKRANVIIGKNNSGKSALIDVFSMLCAPSSNTNVGQLDFEIERGLNEQERQHLLKTQSGYVQQMLRNGSNIIDDARIRFRKDGNQYKVVSSGDDLLPRPMNNVLSQDNVFTRYKVLRLNAERDIVPENDRSDGGDWDIPSKGSGITQMIQAILNWDKLDQEIVENVILEAFNKITNPDVDILRIQTKYDNTGGNWQIYFNEPGKGLIPLSQSGSGLKTILAVLIFIHALPKIIRNIEQDKVIYAFEELENNLHPSVERKLYDYIEDQSRELKFSYFISTHSTVALDYYYRLDDAGIFQVSKSDNGSALTTISNNNDVSNLIDDLGQRASDILQSNCIIWVEGPSDRIYINKWLELSSRGELKENKHYTVMFYGGKLLSHITFNANMAESEIKSMICMFNINRHSIVVIDSDRKSKGARINDTKARIKKEFENTESICWITQGREIENYIMPEAYKRVGLISNASEIDDQFYDVIGIIAKNSSKPKQKSSVSKVSVAREVTAVLEQSDLDVLDLRKRIEGVYSKIRQWNDLGLSEFNHK